MGWFRNRPRIRPRTGKADGVGFVFTDDDPIVGVDLDDCRDPETGEVDSEAQDIIERLDSYTEISPSGTGYHVLIEGELPEGRNRRGHIELYDRARFFTVTGEHIQETPTHIARRQDALVAIHREYVQRSSSDEKSNSPNRGDLRTSQTPLIVLTLRSTTRTLISMMRNSWRKLGVLQTDRSSSDSGGNTGGYESNSEADMALCCLLAFWSGGNQRQMDRLFRQSGLLRENGMRSTLPMGRPTVRRLSRERFRTPRSSTILVVGTNPSNLKSRVNHRVRLPLMLALS